MTAGLKTRVIRSLGFVTVVASECALCIARAGADGKANLDEGGSF
jgi:hypothetical protein